MSSVRIEKKLDELLTVAKEPNRLYQPLQYQGQVDPLSKRPINYVQYTLEDNEPVVVRRDGNAPMPDIYAEQFGEINE